MTRAEISSRVIKICKHKSYIVDMQIFECTDLRNDMGLDSLDLQNLLFDIEVEFGVTITEKELSSLNTIGDVVEEVYKKL